MAVAAAQTHGSREVFESVLTPPHVATLISLSSAVPVNRTAVQLRALYCVYSVGQSTAVQLCHGTRTSARGYRQQGMSRSRTIY